MPQHKRLLTVYQRFERWAHRYKWIVLAIAAMSFFGFLALNATQLGDIWDRLLHRAPVLVGVAVVAEVLFNLGVACMLLAAGSHLGWKFWTWRKPTQGWLDSPKSRRLLAIGFHLNWIGAVFGPTGIPLAVVVIWILPFGLAWLMLVFPVWDILQTCVSRVAFKPRRPPQPLVVSSP